MGVLDGGIQITRAAEVVLRRGSVSETLSKGTTWHEPVFTCNLEAAKTPGSSA
jgi:hypothetical protein